MQDQNHQISSDEVSAYLRNNPHFFEHHANLLAEIYLPSPHGSGAISLAERQQLAQRDKIRVLDTMIAQMIASASENDVTSKKVHDFSVKLIAAMGSRANFERLQELITQSMQHDFSVTHSQSYLWFRPSDGQLNEHRAFAPIANSFSDWLMTLKAPFCGEKPELVDVVFPENLQSFAFIPLYLAGEDKPMFGVLILGSEDPKRFKENMGSLYLECIGDIVSAAYSAFR